MRRMWQRVDTALAIHPIGPSSLQLSRRPFRLACRVENQPDNWPARSSKWSPQFLFANASRPRGRPSLRWDFRLVAFTQEYLGTSLWQTSFVDLAMPSYEDAYVLFHHRLA